MNTPHEDQSKPSSCCGSPRDAVSRRAFLKLSGAAGVEWYFGYQPLPIGGDLDVEDFRTRAPMWRSMRIARQFIQTHLPFSAMRPADELLSDVL